MSPTSVHTQLVELFHERNPETLKRVLFHSDFESFLKIHEFRKLSVGSLVVALTHTSFSNEYEVRHQELAEFLGDSVLQLIVTDELMRRYPHEAEGTLSKLRSSIVNEKVLAGLGKSLGLQNLLLVGKGEFKKELFLQDAALADSVEALICQIYRFEGFDKARDFVLKCLTQTDGKVFDLESLIAFDSKSKLQEATLAKYKTLPKYQSSEESGGFKVELWINEKLMLEGTYPSKKKGERELAERALKERLI